MPTIKVDYKGLRCPQPILKISAKSMEMKPGDILEAEANCPSFEKDVKTWCEKVGKTLLSMRKDEAGIFYCQIKF